MLLAQTLKFEQNQLMMNNSLSSKDFSLSHIMGVDAPINNNNNNTLNMPNVDRTHTTDEDSITQLALLEEDVINPMG